jgi:hypothetical protein
LQCKVQHGRTQRIAHHKSRIANRTSHVAYRTSHIAHRISHIAYRTSLFLLLASCDFEEKNINPNYNTSIAPSTLFTYALLYNSNEGLAKRTQVGCCMMMVQQAASTQPNEADGDKYLESEIAGTFFTDAYPSAVKHLAELLYLVADDPAQQNTRAAALIWKSFVFHRLTDLYGDVPYSEAGGGYRQQIFYPKYDAQSDIYAGLIADVEAALALLDPSKPAVGGDILYDGDVEKWRRFGGSLLLRLGTRLEHANPVLAQATVQSAVASGVMVDCADICMLRHITGKSDFENPLGHVFQSHGLLGSGAIKVSKTFVDLLRRNRDPRMTVYCALLDGNTDTAVQQGLPNGNDLNTIPTSTLGIYSTFNPATLLRLDAPTIHLTHAETELLLAEATAKGWLAGGDTDAKQHYEQAVRSSMQQQELCYGEAGKISSAQIDAYLAQDFFGHATTTELKLELIGTEFWVSTFINGYESFANWRRCGYPRLVPVAYFNSPYSGIIPRRLTYPTDEMSVNAKNLQAAIDRQGADVMITRVWWDRK